MKKIILLLCVLFVATGFANEGHTMEYFAYSGAYKVEAPALQLFV